MNIAEILAELEYRVEEGIIDLTKKEHLVKLTDILNEIKCPSSALIVEAANKHFAYLKEAEIVKPANAKFPAGGKWYTADPNSGGKYVGKVEKGRWIAANQDTTDKVATTKTPKPTEVPPKKDAQPTSAEKNKSTPTTDVDVSDAEKRKKDDKSLTAKSPIEIKKEIDRISIEAGQSRDMFYEKGYHKAEGDDDSGAAPGNAGSMLNENGSVDVCEWSLENDNTNLTEAVKYLYGKLKGGALLEAEDKTGIAGQTDKVPSITTPQLKQFRASGNGAFDDLSDGQLSRLMVAANGGLIKARNLKQGIKNNNWIEEDCIVNGFFGDVKGKSQQLDMVRQSNKIFAPDGKEIPKEDALRLVEAGGGGANPSDTSQFVYNQKTGDLMIKFTSDKDSFGAIVAQSSFQKEGSIKKNQIDSLVKEGKLNKEGAEKLKQLIDKKTKILNSIESELKSVVAEPAKKMMSKPPNELYKLALQFNTSDGGKKRLALIEKKYGKGGDGIKNLFKVAADTPDELSAGDRRVIDDLKKHYGLDYLVSKKVDDIRKRSVAVERQMLDEMNKIKIPISNEKVGLGDYMDALNFVDKFHMAGAMGDRHGVFAYDGLFEVVCGVGVINNKIIAECMNTNKLDEFIKKFGSTKEEFQLSKENQITGSVRIAYFLNDKGEQIRIGEKRQRSKTGATGRFNTVYKWDNDTINCFKQKNGVA